MRNQRVVRTLLATIATLAAIAPTALAGESLRAAVSIPAGQPEPLITANGNPYAQGNYAVGTLRLEYTYVGFVFQPGPFGRSISVSTRCKVTGARLSIRPR